MDNNIGIDLFKRGQVINSSRNRTFYIVREIKPHAIIIGGKGIKDRINELTRYRWFCVAY
jgi:hypothetical protein